VSRNPFSHKIVVNKGTNEGVMQGLPVIDGTGVVGQVTTVTPFSAEVTLLIEKDQAIPVTLAPMISVWISCVPSYVFTDSRFIRCRMMG